MRIYQSKVYLVGAGPGSPGLITVKGLEILRQADVVIYDYLVDKRLLSEAKAGAQLVCCDTLGKKRYSDGFLITTKKINQLVIKKAKEGKKVIRLKNGDPSIFSRLSEELDALVKEKIEFEVVPGVTAASAASCFSGTPLTDRRFASSCVIVTGHERPEKEKSSHDWKALVGSGTIVLYMAVENLARISGYLLKAGKNPDTQVAIVQGAGSLTQKVLTADLKSIAQKARIHKVKAPAIIIIGEVARLEKKFNWLNKNRKILFTGLSKERFFIKGTYFHLPMIEIIPKEDYRDFDGYLRKIAEFDWIIFTSRYAVEYFFNRFEAAGLDARRLGGIKIAAVGTSTAKSLRDFAIIAELVPEKESSVGLLEAFKKINLKDKKIFFPRSNLSDKGLTEGLKNLGAKVFASVAYKNIPAKELPDLDLNYFDEVMFTSPSGVRSFIKRYGRLPKKVKVSCIGEVTENEARKWRLLN